MPPALAEMIEQLESRGQLVRVSAEVDAQLEVAEIVARLAQREPAILFERIAGVHLPLLVNLLGPGRLGHALGVDETTWLAGRLDDWFAPQTTGGWLNALKQAKVHAARIDPTPKTVRVGACQQVVHLGSDVDLAQLPIPTCWPHDSGPSLHGGLLMGRDPASGEHVIEALPLALLDRRHLAAFIPPDSRLRNALEQHREREPLPVAVLFGAPAVFQIAARLSFLPVADAVVLAGLLQREAVELANARTIDLQVPTSSEMVLEGLIDPAEPPLTDRRLGMPTGYYYQPREAFSLEVTAITHRASPVLSVEVPTSTPSGSAMSQAVDSLLVPWLQSIIPDVAALHSPTCSYEREFVFVALRKRRPQQARQVAAALWGLAPLATAKVLVLVDAEVDVRDDLAVWREVGRKAHPGRDVFFHQGPASPVDPASPVPLCGHAMAIDATTKLAAEHGRPWPEAVAMSEEVRQRVTQRWQEYGL